jgi:hypothetical protein
MQKHHYLITGILVIVAFVAGLTLVGPGDKPGTALKDPHSILSYTVSDHATETHHASSDVPCKSEFPESWSKEKIDETLLAIAHDKTLNWKQEENGYFVVDKEIENLVVRTVVDREKNVVVTGYPVNVERNACPAREGNSNDNAEPAPAQQAAP